MQISQFSGFLTHKTDHPNVAVEIFRISLASVKKKTVVKVPKGSTIYIHIYIYIYLDAWIYIPERGKNPVATSDISADKERRRSLPNGNIGYC
jgi:hypothetical protein